jgi:hypothetical protein
VREPSQLRKHCALTALRSEWGPHSPLRNCAPSMTVQTLRTHYAKDRAVSGVPQRARCTAARLKRAPCRASPPATRGHLKFKPRHRARQPVVENLHTSQEGQTVRPAVA